LRGLEPALRELLSASLRRGKIELRASTPGEADGAWPHASAEQLNRLARLEAQVQSWLPQARTLSVNEALLWCRGAAVAERLDEAALQAARACIAALLEAREREGARLVDVLRDKLAALRELAAAAEPMVPAVVQRQQQRFIERWTEALASSGGAQTFSADALRERALNEAAAYAIRIDVAEELARLRAPGRIERLLDAGGTGQALDFLDPGTATRGQHAGSKSAALELTNVSVQMKVLVEQMREQVQRH
jgi:uncharacterized protein (TIGR00255 family)